MVEVLIDVSEEEEKMMRCYANAMNLSMSAFIRITVLEHIEHDMDLRLYQEAQADHEASPDDRSFDETLEELEGKRD